MRIGLTLSGPDAPGMAIAADRAGLAAVVVPAGTRGDGITLAAEIAARTRDIRIIVTVPLGVEHPVTLAEEIAVVDHVSGGRLLALLDTGELSAAEAEEDVAILREAWSGRWLAHSGTRWQIPAGLHGENSPTAIAVTPTPAQLELPVWLTGTAAGPIAATTGLPLLAERSGALADVDRSRTSPGVATLTGDLESDRAMLAEWVGAGASIVAVALADGQSNVDIERYVARFLAPEVGMPHFPRIIAESPWPASWVPRSDGAGAAAIDNQSLT